MNRTHFLLCIVLFGSLMNGTTWAQSNAVPLVNQPLSPTRVFPGHGAFTLNVTGTGFVSGAVVNWNGASRTTTFVSSSRLQAAINSADVAHPGTAAVTVVNPTPGGGTSNVVYFPVKKSSSAIAFARRDLPLTLASGSFLSALAVGDFNKDGKVDVAIALSQNQGRAATVEVFLGNGDGSFQTPISTTLSIDVNSLLVGDFNGDGNLDLAVAYPFLCGGCGGYPSYLLYTLLGTGDGHFNLAGNGSIYGWPLAGADFNADGKLDVFTTVASYDGTDWYPATNLGNGDGTFGAEVGMGDSYISGVPSVGDFNHDGRLDLAVPALASYAGNPALDVFLGKGDGTFQSPVIYSIGNQAGSAAVGDVNRDGKLDIVTDDLSVLLGNGDGTFTNAGSVTVKGFDVHLADFNGDNKLDAILLGQPYYNGSPFENVTLLLGNGDGTFQSPQSWPSPTTPAFRVGVGDFNGDGKLDAVDVGVDSKTGATVLSVFLQTTLSISPTLLNFGYVKVGTSSTPLTSTLTNIGQKNVSIGAIKSVGAGTNYTESNNCGASLAPGASCTITVTFTPKSKKVLNAFVSVNYSGTIGNQQSFPLTGVGY